MAGQIISSRWPSVNVGDEEIVGQFDLLDLEKVLDSATSAKGRKRSSLKARNNSRSRTCSHPRFQTGPLLIKAVLPMNHRSLKLRERIAWDSRNAGRASLSRDLRN